MVNYKAKIEELKQNGTLNKEQANRLSSSFEQNQTPPSPTQRKYSLEMIGALLLLIVVVYIVTLIILGDQTQVVEDTAKMLNAPATSGLHSSSSFVMVVLFVTLVAYLILYLLAYNRYNTLWMIDEERRALKQIIHNGDVFKMELGAKLEKLVQDSDAHQKDSRSDVEIKLDSQESPRRYLMEFYKELEEEIRSDKDRLAILESRSTSGQNRFPNTLAKFIGKLPISRQ